MEKFDPRELIKLVETLKPEEKREEDFFTRHAKITPPQQLKSIKSASATPPQHPATEKTTLLTFRITNPNSSDSPESPKSP